MEEKTELAAFLEDPDATALAQLAEALEEWPEANRIVKLAARAIYLEDERLERLLQEAVSEAERLLGWRP